MNKKPVLLTPFPPQKAVQPLVRWSCIWTRCSGKEAMATCNPDAHQVGYHVDVEGFLDWQSPGVWTRPVRHTITNALAAMSLA